MATQADYMFNPLGTALVEGAQDPINDMAGRLKNQMTLQQLAAEKQKMEQSAQMHPLDMQTKQLNNEQTGLENVGRKYTNDVNAQVGIGPAAEAKLQEFTKTGIRNQKDAAELIHIYAPIADQIDVSSLQGQDQWNQLKQQMGKFIPPQVMGALTQGGPKGFKAVSDAMLTQNQKYAINTQTTQNRYNIAQEKNETGLEQARISARARMAAAQTSAGASMYGANTRAATERYKADVGFEKGINTEVVRGDYKLKAAEALAKVRAQSSKGGDPTLAFLKILPAADVATIDAIIANPDATDAQVAMALAARDSKITKAERSTNKQDQAVITPEGELGYQNPQGGARYSRTPPPIGRTQPQAPAAPKPAAAAPTPQAPQAQQPRYVMPKGDAQAKIDAEKDPATKAHLQSWFDKTYK